VTRKKDEKDPKRNADVPLPAGEDPHAAERVQEILKSASYRRADQDTDFLNIDETRGLRLDLEYLKVNLLLERHGIEQTIVVFGSTGIPEASEGRRRVDRARAELRKEPDNPILIQGLRIAERVSAKSTFYTVAREFGSLVGKSGEGPKDCRVVLVTGGGPGIMEAANRGAFDVGAESVGLNISLPQAQFPNAFVTPELCFKLRYFAIRKLHVLLRARALVVFPGGFGTLDELFETLTLVQTGKIEPLPVLQEGVIDLQDRDLFWYAETAQEIWDGICQWHRDTGNVLYADVQSAN
jgi:uncharacterized protein (TIGR00730 family)